MQAPRAPQQTKPGIFGAPRPPSAPAWSSDGQPRAPSAPAWNKDGEPGLPDDDEQTKIVKQKVSAEVSGAATTAMQATAAMQPAPAVATPPAPAAAAATPAAPPAQATPALSPSFTREDVRAMVRGAIDEALAPVRHMLSDVDQRLAELEHRPRAQSSPRFEGTIAATPAALVSRVAAVAPAAAPSTPSPYAAAMAPPPAPTPPPVAAPVPASLSPRIDLAAIERDVKLDDAELALLDGRKRKRRNTLLLVFFILVIFGGMFGMLAKSYMHTQ
jgi:hypothetical protein